VSTAHFADSELACNHCGALPPQEFQDLLEAFRVQWGRPMKLSSAFRCSAHNIAVSTTGPNGPHTIGAVDVAIEGPEAYGFVLAAMHFGWTGIGIHQRGSGRFVHLDMLQDGSHPRPRIWSYA
jgi:hypothetical protein